MSVLAVRYNEQEPGTHMGWRSFTIRLVVVSAAKASLAGYEGMQRSEEEN